MKSLRMRRSDLEDLPNIVLPTGYELRTFQPGDEVTWGQIMDTGIEGGWSVEKVRSELIDCPQFEPDGLFFVTYHGEPVGSACAWREPVEEKDTGHVHMVCVLPEHRGKHLGYILTLCTLHWFRAHSFLDAYLETDNWRLSAIKTYLDLGFEPILVDDEDRASWQAIAQQLGVMPA